MERVSASWGCSGLGQVRGSVVECRRTPKGGGFWVGEGFHGCRWDGF